MSILERLVAFDDHALLGLVGARHLDVEIICRHHSSVRVGEGVDTHDGRLASVLAVLIFHPFLLDAVALVVDLQSA